MNVPDTTQGVATLAPVASSPAVQAARPLTAASGVLMLRQDGNPRAKPAGAETACWLCAQHDSRARRVTPSSHNFYKPISTGGRNKREAISTAGTS